MLTSYSFQIIALGTALLAVAAGMVGCLNVYRGQSLIGDAVGHSSFPGVILAFMLFLTRDPGILLLGAIATGFLAYVLIQIANNYSKLGLDASLAVYLSGFFGLGMVLKSYIQGNPDYATSTKSGLSHYIFGQAAYMLEADVLWIAGVAGLCLITLALFYKEIKLYVFDPDYARTIGIPKATVDIAISVMTIALIGVGLKAVGAILISSFLILPCVTAGQWSKSFSHVLLISALCGAFSAVTGTMISTLGRGLSTGPCIILVGSALAIFSMVFGRYGLISRLKGRKHA